MINEMEFAPISADRYKLLSLDEVGVDFSSDKNADAIYSCLKRSAN